MSRQLEAKAEERTLRRQKGILIAVEFGLVDAIEGLGGVLTGFAYKDRGVDCLLVLKAEREGVCQVAFVGAEDLGSLLIKAVKLAKSDKLVWKGDEYRTQVLVQEP